jgi:hypothetical protein
MRSVWVLARPAVFVPRARVLAQRVPGRSVVATFESRDNRKLRGVLHGIAVALSDTDNHEFLALSLVHRLRSVGVGTRRGMRRAQRSGRRTHRRRSNAKVW